MVFEGGNLQAVKEIILDRIVIQCETGDYELVLSALPPASDVSIMGDLNFGLVPTDSKATKRLQLINKGSSPASFKIESSQ